MSRRLTVVLTVVVSLMTVNVPAFAEGEIVVDGGGWGHGIGMSQHGAKALAESGASTHEILSHFYTGIDFGLVGTGNLVGHADPLRIGVAQDLGFVLFGAIGGPVSLCQAGSCLYQAQPTEGAVWSFRSVDVGQCQYFKAGVAQGLPGTCDGALSWAGQPGVRVEFPDLNREYARGSVIFTGAPGNTFHVLVELGLEEYLYGLGEMPSSWPDSALQAQAMAGRTYALWKAWVYRDLESNQARMDSCACHLYASTFDQKYIGWAKEAEGNGFWGAKWVAAVDANRRRGDDPLSGGRPRHPGFLLLLHRWRNGEQ